MRTRQKTRKLLTVPGRYFTGRGSPVDVMLSDLSEGGCRFSAEDTKLAAGLHLQIFIAGTGPYQASIRWIDDGEVGVTFASPLEAAQFEQFQNSHVQAFSPDAAGSAQDQLPRRLC